MARVSWQSLPAMFFDQAAKRRDQPFLWAKDDGAYRSIAWGETAEHVNLLAGGLKALGVAKGDRVALISENRPEWLIADHAIMAAGGITVPAFVTNTSADHRHVLTHSGAKGAIVSSRAIAQRLLPAALESSDLKFVISLEPLEIQQRVPFSVHDWDAVLARGASMADGIAARMERLNRQDVCCIIYTSGTGGTPKGVMLSHGAILCNCAGAIHVLAELGLDDEVFLSF
ncbi:MAG: AMP-binding protein, partial [Pseudomonadota bacterium]